MFRARRGAAPSRLFPPDELLDGGENHAAARDAQQFSQMLDRIRPHRSLTQDFVATLELAEWKSS